MVSDLIEVGLFCVIPSIMGRAVTKLLNVREALFRFSSKAQTSGSIRQAYELAEHEIVVIVALYIICAIKRFVSYYYQGFSDPSYHDRCTIIESTVVSAVELNADFFNVSPGRFPDLLTEKLRISWNLCHDSCQDVFKPRLNGGLLVLSESKLTFMCIYTT